MTIRTKLLTLFAVFMLMASLMISFMAYRSYQDSLFMASRDGKALSIALANYVSVFMKTAEEYALLASKMPAMAASAGHLPTNLNPDAPYSRRNLSPEAAALDVVLQGAKESGPRFLEAGFVDTNGGILVYPADPPAGLDFRTRP